MLALQGAGRPQGAAEMHQPGRGGPGGCCSWRACPLPARRDHLPATRLLQSVHAPPRHRWVRRRRRRRWRCCTATAGRLQLWAGPELPVTMVHNAALNRDGVRTLHLPSADICSFCPRDYASESAAQTPARGVQSGTSSSSTTSSGGGSRSADPDDASFELSAELRWVGFSHGAGARVACGHQVPSGCCTQLAAVCAQAGRDCCMPQCSCSHAAGCQRRGTGVA